MAIGLDAGSELVNPLVRHLFDLTFQRISTKYPKHIAMFHVCLMLMFTRVCCMQSMISPSVAVVMAAAQAS